MMLSYAVRPLSNIISDICFPAGTLVKTDQGDIQIETIIPEIHTINKKNIISITKTISFEKYLICLHLCTFKTPN